MLHYLTDLLSLTPLTSTGVQEMDTPTIAGKGFKKPIVISINNIYYLYLKHTLLQPVHFMTILNAHRGAQGNQRLQKLLSSVFSLHRQTQGNSLCLPKALSFFLLYVVSVRCVPVRK